MATITSKVIIQQMLTNDGIFFGDPQVAEIWEYEHLSTGQIMWSIFMKPQHNDLRLSPFVGRHELLWSKELGHVNEIGVLQNRSLPVTGEASHVQGE